MSNTRHDDLIIPLYLNQRIVFDQIAMLQNGIATITQVARNSNESLSSGIDGKAAFNLGGVLSSLLKIDIFGKYSKNKSSTDAEIKSEERIHTPSSLFFEYRKSLIDKGYLKFENKEYWPELGHFVEFKTSFHVTPLVETLISLSRTYNIIYQIATDIHKNENPVTCHTNDKNKGNREPIEKISDMKEHVDLFLKTIADDNNIDLLTDVLDCKFKALMTLDCLYMDEKSILSITAGKFRVLGKVIDVFDDGNQDVSLLRRTALSGLSPATVDDLLNAFNVLVSMRFPESPPLTPTIKGPVFQIIPIAIYA